MKNLGKLSNWISEKSTGQVTLIFLILFLVFTSTVLPDQSKKAESYSAGVGSVDLRLWYSADEVYKMAEVYGEEGRQAYIQARLTFDVIWPIVYMLFLTTSISYVFKKTFPLDMKVHLINLLPILSLIFDYLENLLASIIMFRFPVRIFSISFLLPFLSLFKWISLFGCFFILINVVSFYWYKSMSKKQLFK